MKKTFLFFSVVRCCCLSLSLELLLPLVAEVVPEYSERGRVLLALPPEGLLEVARMDAQAQAELGWLEEELDPFMEKITLPDGSLHTVMPTREALREAGEHSLVYHINKLGGFQEVATLLGVQPRKRPGGWWDLQKLHEEITDFMSALWTEIKDPDTGEVYYFHQITGEQSEELPERDEAGGGPVTSVDGYMPTVTAIKAAGRWDLHYGIMENGGYTQVGKILERKAVSHNFYLQEMQGSFECMAAEVRAAMRELEDITGEPQVLMPTMQTLRDMGLNDLERAIQFHGGFPRVASRMGLPQRHRPKGYWRDIRNIQKELMDFVKQQQMAPHGESPEMDMLYMPTLEELRRAGRHDLRYALQLHGSTKVATVLGLKLRKRGRAPLD
mmetsp:Transcript_6332/g.17938  ORF Transcript_6332/g.17938 Transcript_6332/m.17938 type:complete len:385 (+) Transcript_6332:945-2099(+)